MEAYDVFLSYSRRDIDVAVDIEAILRNSGLSVWRDDRLEAGSVFSPAIEDALRRSRSVVVLWSKNTERSKWVIAEATLAAYLDKLVPFTIERCDIPVALSKINSVDVSEPRGRAQKILSAVGQVPGGSQPLALPRPKIDVRRLPRNATPFKGRMAQLHLLQEMVAQARLLPSSHEIDVSKTNVLQIVASGGTGKTALIAEWLNDLSCTGKWFGIERVFAWSFYGQDVSGGHQAAAGLFFEEALRWFGHRGPKPASPWLAAQALVSAVRRKKAIIVLDGIEPLQHGPGPIGGQFRDRALSFFLQSLAEANPGLCVITSRINSPDLSCDIFPRAESSVLGNLESQDAVSLLRELGVHSPNKTTEDEELAAAAKEFGHHALAIVLVGRYLKNAFGGDVINTSRIGPLTEDPTNGGHAKRVMRAYESWLPQDSCEQAALWVLAAFDGPAPMEAIRSLQDGAISRGPAKRIAESSPEEWIRAVNNLVAIGLVGSDRSDFLGSLDCHPLVREYFRARFVATNENAWFEINKSLLQYYRSVPVEELPTTLVGLSPLLSEIAQSIRANEFDDAFDRILTTRVNRGAEYFAMLKLGAYADQLAAISHFFDHPWTSFKRGVNNLQGAELLAEVNFGLRALGRHRLAVEPTRLAIAFANLVGSKGDVAKAIGDLAEIFLAIGSLSDARVEAKKSVEAADQSPDTYQQMTKRALYADILHQLGFLRKASQLLEEAEGIQRERNPTVPYLFSYRAYRLNELLIERGEFSEAEKRAAFAAEKDGESGKSLMNSALHKLTLARLYGSRPKGERRRQRADIETLLKTAIAEIRNSGFEDELPNALLTTAAWKRSEGQHKQALTYLREAYRRAMNFDMTLRIADCHIEAARLAIVSRRAKMRVILDDVSVEYSAASHCDRALNIIESTGYRRKLPELHAAASMDPNLSRHQREAHAHNALQVAGEIGMSIGLDTMSRLTSYLPLPDCTAE